MPANLIVTKNSVSSVADVFDESQVSSINFCCGFCKALFLVVGYLR